jgi:amino acid transporter
MNKNEIWFTIGMSIIFISFFIGTFPIKVTGTKMVNCYDRHNNVIQGQICIEKQYFTILDYFPLIKDREISICIFGFFIALIALLTDNRNKWRCKK